MLLLKHLNLSFNKIDQEFIFEEKFGLISQSLEKLYLVGALSNLSVTMKILSLLPKTIYDLDLSHSEGISFAVVKYLNSNYT